MDILSVTGTVLFTSALNLLRDVVIEAVSKRVNLSGANLSGVNLSGVNLSRANLYGADLSGANLSGANLSGVNLSGVNLSRVNLSGVNLSRANLYGADLSGANLSGANLSGANLSRVNLYGANLPELVIARLQFIPEEGSFVGWKKCRNNVIVKLYIGKTAKRSHGGERKCRASRVKVAEVFGAAEGISMYDEKVIYRKGDVVEPLNGWGENRWDVCAPGIHFFITRAEAEAYDG